MGKWNMPVADIFKEMYLVTFEEKARRYGVNWSISPSLIEETAVSV